MPRARMVRFAQLRRQGPATATERRLMLEQHQHALAERMRALEEHMAALRQKIARVKEVEARRDAASHPDHALDRSDTAAGAGDAGTEK